MPKDDKKDPIVPEMDADDIKDVEDIWNDDVKEEDKDKESNEENKEESNDASDDDKKDDEKSDKSDESDEDEDKSDEDKSKDKPKDKPEDKADDKEDEDEAKDEDDDAIDSVTEDGRGNKSTIPSWKMKASHKQHEKEKKKMVAGWDTEKAELETKLADALKLAGKAKQDEATEKAIDELADKSGIDKETIKGLADILTKSIQIPENKGGLTKEDKERLGKVEEHIEWQRQERVFNKEWDRDVSKLVDKDVPKEMRQKVKKKIHDLAFSTQSHTELKNIYRRDEFDKFKTQSVDEDTKKKGKKSAQPSGVQPRPEVVSDDEIGPEDSDADYDKWLAKQLKIGNAQMFSKGKKNQGVI